MAAFPVWALRGQRCCCCPPPITMIMGATTRISKRFSPDLPHFHLESHFQLRVFNQTFVSLNFS